MIAADPTPWDGADSDDAEALAVADRIGQLPTAQQMRELDALTARRRQATGATYRDAWKEALEMTYPTPTVEPYEPLRDPVTVDELREQLRAEQRDDAAELVAATATTKAGQIVSEPRPCREQGCTAPSRGGRGRYAPYCRDHNGRRVEVEAAQVAAIRNDDAHQEQDAGTLELPAAWTLAGFIARCEAGA